MKFHVMPTSEGFSLFNDNMEYIIPRALSINLLTSEINKFDRGSVVVYHTDIKGHYKLHKVIRFNKDKPFTGALT